MAKKICIIGVYYGKFPNYFPLWLKSCQYNDTINFLIITDQYIESVPKNVKVVQMDFFDLKKLVQKPFDFQISLKRPYKICDFRPAFGLIFADYLKEYDFWGHCDFDLIFGDLKKFFTDELLDSFDKILPLGHLSIYRNTEECNNRFKLAGSLVGDYKTVFTNDRNFIFDELGGIYQIYKSNHFPVYDKRVFADISYIYKRFRLAKKDKNYDFQIFSWDNGKIYREYFVNDIYLKDEFIYIHMGKRKNLEIKFALSNDINSYLITNSGFYLKNGQSNLSDIKKYNSYKGLCFECFELLKFRINELVNKVVRKFNKLIHNIHNE